jgi:peptidoglycan hydrolase-like protein with peptidoglycan-binding domain
MKIWTCAMAVTVAGAMLAATAFAQGTGGSSGSGSPGTSSPGASGSGTGTTGSGTTGSGGTGGALTTPTPPSPSASPSTSPSTTPGGSAATTDTKSDAAKGEMKAGKSARGAMAGGGNRDQVRKVQEALKDKGHDPGPVDGVMGPRTRAALKDFQKAEGLKDSGQLTKETLDKLNVQASAAGSPSPSASPATGGSTGATSKDASGSSGAGSTPSPPAASGDKKPATDKK